MREPIDRKISSLDTQLNDAKSRSLTDLMQEVNVTNALRQDSGAGFGSSSDCMTSVDSLFNVYQSVSSSSCVSLSSPMSTSAISAASVDSGRTKDSHSSDSTNDAKEEPVSHAPKYVQLQSIDSGLEVDAVIGAKKKHVLTKQKASINESEFEFETPILIEISKPDNKVPDTVKEESLDNDDNMDYLSIPKGLGIIKQSSLNDEFIFPDRFMEKEKIKQGIQKQCSLNDDLIYGNKEAKYDSLKDTVFKVQVKRFQVIRESFEKLRTSSLDRFETEKPESIRNGILRLLHTWRSELLSGKRQRSAEFNDRHNDINSEIEAARKKTSGSFDSTDSRRSSLDEIKGFFFGMRERKCSIDDESDSSKENSFQSDTSIDSEDSCISVIFVPKPGQAIPPGYKERNKSVSSESSDGSDKPLSPKSPKSPKSPGTCAAPSRYFPSNRIFGSITTSTKSFPAFSNGDTTVINTSMSNFDRIKQSFLSNDPPRCSSTRTSSLDNFENKEYLSPKTTQETYQELFRQNSLNSKSLIDDAVRTASIAPSNQSMKRVTFSPICLGKLNEKNSISSNVVIKNKASGINKIDLITSSCVIGPRLNFSESNPNYDTENPNFSKVVVSTKVSPCMPVDKVEIITNPSILGSNNGQIIRKTIPRCIAYDVFNPELDDSESDNSSSDSSSSTSPSTHSESSVIERGWPTEKDIEELDKEIKRREEEERLKNSNILSQNELQESFSPESIKRMGTIREEFTGRNTSENIRCCLSAVCFILLHQKSQIQLVRIKIVN